MLDDGDESQEVIPIRPAPVKTPFSLKSNFEPRGDQPQAIEKLVAALNAQVRFQTLRGITGSGKTFTMANVIKQVSRPTLIIAPNKTLAAQLYSEFKEFFPDNRVRYFVSYYDYYQPEAYIPSTDTFIEKDSAINEEIDKMRHSATKALLEGTDTIIVASVSCIYGLGAPDEYFKMMLFVEVGETLTREEIILKLVKMQYKREDFEFKRGTFRVRGETIDVFPSDQDAHAIRIVLFGDEVEELREIDGLSGQTVRRLVSAAIYPVSHFVTGAESVVRALSSIRKEMIERVKQLQEAGKPLEAQRLEQRTLYDLELLKEVGFCPGIENYSRHMAGRAPGTPPTTLIDYFPDDFLLVLDESHVTVPQIGGMARGDRARKQNLIEYGFRLPSAVDNRPLTGDEFWERVGQTIFVSATPADFELEKSGRQIVEQINRPTGLLDPEVSIRPATNQVDDVITEIRAAIEKGERIIVTVLTKKMAEQLSKYLQETGIKSRYLHSDINTVERVEILRGLRRGDFDVLIGINLLREGLDLVEVALVAVLDADKEGFLRSERSIIQTIGRAARNLNGRAILYADRMTDSIRGAVAETVRRRKIQAEYNQAHGIVPRSASRPIEAALSSSAEDGDPITLEALVDGTEQAGVGALNGGGTVKGTAGGGLVGLGGKLDPKALEREIQELKKEMYAAAKEQEFERAAQLRDRMHLLQKTLMAVSDAE